MFLVASPSLQAAQPTRNHVWCPPIPIAPIADSEVRFVDGIDQDAREIAA